MGCTAGTDVWRMAIVPTVPTVPGPCTCIPKYAPGCRIDSPRRTHSEAGTSPVSLVARLVRSRHFQFFSILPNQIVLWAVIFIGVLGTTVPGLNVGAAITCCLWFCLVVVMMVVVSRACSSPATCRLWPQF